MIYKLGLRVCESCDVGEKLQDAQIAQIRGGFINWDLDYLRKWVVV